MTDHYNLVYVHLLLDQPIVMCDESDDQFNIQQTTTTSCVHLLLDQPIVMCNESDDQFNI